MNYKLIDNIVIDGIDNNDYPDFSDAFIISADYNGKTMTDEQLDEINEDRDFVYQCVLNNFFNIDLSNVEMCKNLYNVTNRMAVKKITKIIWKIYLSNHKLGSC